MIALLPSVGGEARLWLSLVAAFVAAALGVVALVRAAPRSATPSAPRDPLPPMLRLAWPLVLLLEASAAATMGPQRRIAVEARLQQAGLARMLTPARHRALCWAAALAGAAVAVALVTMLGASGGAMSGAAVGSWLGSSAGSIVGVAAGAALAGLLPVARLRDRAASRQRAMLRQLPFFLDLISMSVEAGLNLGAALAQAVDRGPPGAMRDELAQLLRELRAGRPRDEAMRALAARAQLPAISSLVAALASTQKQGASLGPILRAQAEQRRTERFLRAEKLAMEAPVKMLMPLVLFIFPGTFAVLLFPVVSRLIAEGVL
jgi:tight adherence protein C